MTLLLHFDDLEAGVPSLMEERLMKWLLTDNVASEDGTDDEGRPMYLLERLGARGT
jgi:hypothetical protein